MTEPEAPKVSRRLIGIVVVAASAVGLGVALTVSGFSFATPSTISTNQTLDVQSGEPTQEALPAPGEGTSVAGEGSVSTPNATPEVPHGTIIQRGETVTTTVTGPKATQSITNETKGAKVTPKPTRTSTPTSTPRPTVSRPPVTGSPTTSGVGYCTPDEPKVWASCTQGYIAPAIEFAGVVSCRAVDRQAGNWAVTIRLALAGGNYRAAQWSGPNQDGTMTITITGTPESILGEEVGLQLNIDVFIKSMDGYPGNIDKLFRSWRQPITPASYCS
jgi:hypothetical protein